jgi:putative nucleotidyltransferase with HDIG domain
MLIAKLVYAGRTAPEDATRILQPVISMQSIVFDRFKDEDTFGAQVAIFDVENFTAEQYAFVKHWQASPVGFGRPVIFIVDDTTRSRIISEGMSRDANLIRRPLDADNLISLVRQLSLRRLGPPPQEKAKARTEHYIMFPKQAKALRAGNFLLDNVFGAVLTGGGLDAVEIARDSTAIIDTLGQTGLVSWVDAVRSHHDMTYQHCLLVTGTLLAVGHHLKMNKADLQRLAVGGLLHDLGKADVPTEILDKPSALTPEEQTIMRRHPVTGVERLALIRNAPSELVAFVRDHHEYLDGSGYPNGLTAKHISDPVRLLTIVDIFAALIENRAYRPPMPGEEAIRIIEGMTGRIDMAILAKVKPVLSKVG